MKLIFDARPMAAQFSGLGRYTGSLLNALLSSQTDPDLEIVVLLHIRNDWDTNFHYHRLKDHQDGDRCSIEYVDALPISLRQHLTLGTKVNSISPDYYFYPHFDMPFGIKANSTFVIHDLIPLIVTGYVQNFSWAKRLYFREMIRYSIAHADCCIAVSETTRRDVLEVVGSRYANKISVAYEGSVLTCSNSSEPIELINKPYLLYVGDRRPHKNLKRILDIFINLRDRYGYGGILVLVGSTQNYDFDVEGYILGRIDIVVLGNVSDVQLIDLYQSADSLIFLSEYEGFGLPVVEAARFGRKMILSDGGALAEIAPPNACIVNRELDVDTATKIVDQYLNTESSFDLTEFNTRFSWVKAAEIVFPYAYK
ncbi:glycosyltransferase family 1 protein [Gammaproteobacteria bacterium LSUCC0112]|nr:glycosyltransferase family 1 protein [Gammaproteobacteria bacterium LSUCC0112]